MAYTRSKNSQWVFAPPGWDIGYRTAQAAWAASGTPIRVWFHGASITQGLTGAPATDLTQCYRWVVRNFLVNKFGRSADYFPVAFSSHYGDSTGVGTNTYSTFTVPPPWLLTTSPLAAAPYGFLNGTPRYGYLNGTLTFVYNAYGGMGGDATWFGPASGQTIATFQHSVATWLETCQAYDLIVPNLNAGSTLSYNVNGAGATNVTYAADGRIQIISMATGLAAGRYDTVLKTVGASVQPWLSGVTAHATTRGAAGVQVAHIGVSTAPLSNMDNNYLTKTAMGVDAGTGTVGAGGFPMGPDLVICDCLIADSGLFSPDISTQRFAWWISAHRRAKPNASFIFLADYQADGVMSDSPATNNYVQGYPTHLEALLAVAGQQSCAFINVHDAWQGKGVGLGYIVSGDPHPTVAGYTAMANLITPLL